MKTFTDALEYRKNKLSSQLKKEEPLEVSINLLLSQNKIEVIFNRYPGQSIASRLGANDFLTAMSSNFGTTYFTTDSEEARQFCRQEFGAELEPYHTEPKVLEPEVLEPKPIEYEVIDDLPFPSEPPTTTYDDNPVWTKYCHQVDTLLAYYKQKDNSFDIADLQILAIDNLLSTIRN